MKKLLVLIFIIGISFISYAQKFQLTDPEGNPYTDGYTLRATITEDDLNESTQEFVTEIVVENLTATQLDVHTLRTNLILVDGMSAYVCFGMCVNSDVYSVDYTIDRGSETYSLHLMPQGNFGLCKFQIDFIAEEQKMTLFIEIDMQSLGIKEANSAVLLSAYPNPVAANTSFNVSYTLADKSYNNRLVVRNILGVEVLTLPLNPYDNSISVNASTLVPGIYFYTIENKNRISIAKKLIVK